MGLEKLVKRLKEGNEEAFDEIYEQTKDAVYYMILSILHDQNLAEDIMQDTYMKMYKSMASYKSSNFKAYLLTIARNLSINEYNRRKRIYDVDSDENPLIFGTKEINDGMPDLVRNLEHYLPSRDLQIVILHAVYDLKHREIAEIMQIPLGSVLSIYSKAIKILKEKWEV